MVFPWREGVCVLSFLSRLSTCGFACGYALRRALRCSLSFLTPFFVGRCFLLLYLSVFISRIMHSHLPALTHFYLALAPARQHVSEIAFDRFSLQFYRVCVSVSGWVGCVMWQIKDSALMWLFCCCFCDAVLCSLLLLRVENIVHAAQLILRRWVLSCSDTIAYELDGCVCLVCTCLLCHRFNCKVVQALYPFFVLLLSAMYHA